VSGGLHLGEVSITEDRDRSTPLGPDDRVTFMSFRKPGVGLLRAATVLAGLGGHQLVFDDNITAVVVGPADRVDDLAATWPW
jgi:hypothetical protein